MIAELSGIIVTVAFMGFSLYRTMKGIFPAVDRISKYLCGD